MSSVGHRGRLRVQQDTLECPIPFQGTNKRVGIGGSSEFWNFASFAKKFNSWIKASSATSAGISLANTYSNRKEIVLPGGLTIFRASGCGIVPKSASTPTVTVRPSCQPSIAATPDNGTTEMIVSISIVLAVS